LACQWSRILALLGFAWRWLTRSTPARRYVDEAVFSFYIARQITIVATDHLRPSLAHVRDGTTGVASTLMK
jgi:hypothetical protein